MENNFGDFLTNPEVYDQCEEFWYKLFSSFQVELDQWNWEPWINNCFANGEKCRDGNPIFSAIDPKRNIGIRVLQYQDELEIQFWIDNCENVKELVIICSLTQGNLVTITKFIKGWMMNESLRTT